MMDHPFPFEELETARRELAPSGVLRAAINIGNPVLACSERLGDSPRGVSVDIARELGRRLACLVELVVFETAGRVFKARDRDAWDVAFLALEPKRAGKVLFSSPYILIEGTYIVRDDGRFGGVGDLDEDGLRIAIALSAAYDLFLTRTVKRAEIVRAPTPAAALEMFLRENLDAAAGVRQALDAFAETRANLRVLPDSFMAIEQALATPSGRETGARYLEEFCHHLKTSGWLNAALERNGQAGARIAPL